MYDEAVDALVFDVDANLKFSTVGLYELLWKLNGDRPDLPLEEKGKIAEAAAERILARPGYGLVELDWKSQSPVRFVDLQELAKYDWTDSEVPDHYFAIYRLEA